MYGRKRKESARRVAQILNLNYSEILFDNIAHFSLAEISGGDADVAFEVGAKE